MPHYVTQLEHEDEFAVYSTVVDNILTDTMTAEQMHDWLVDRDYTSWLTPPGDNSDLDAYDEEMRQHITKFREQSAQYFYWHDQAKFQYVKLDDGYFVLPRDCWRFE